MTDRRNSLFGTESGVTCASQGPSHLACASKQNTSSPPHKRILLLTQREGLSASTSSSSSVGTPLMPLSSSSSSDVVAANNQANNIMHSAVKSNRGMMLSHCRSSWSLTRAFIALILTQLGVNADVPFIGVSSSVLSQQRHLNDNSHSIISPFGVVKTLRGGTKESDKDWGGEAEHDEVDPISSTSDEGKVVEEEDSNEEDEEDDFVDTMEDEDEDYEEVAFGDAVEPMSHGVEELDEIDDNEQTILDEAEGGDQIQEFEEEDEDDGVFEDPLVDDENPEENEAIVEPDEEALEERMVAGVATTDDESSAFVDRMELADAYDEGETTTGTVEDTAPAISPGGGDETSAPEPVEPVVAESTVVAEITDEMKKILRKDLGYTPTDIEAIRPDIASVVVAKRLQRPVEGMPHNFYKDGKPPASRPQLPGTAVKIAVALVGVGATAVAVSSSDLIDLDEISSLVKKIPTALAAVPAALASLMPSRTSKTALPATPEAPIIEEKEEEEEATPKEEEVSVEDDHGHSIKPYTHEPPVEDLDKTWLDKLITKIENAIKGALNVKI